MFLCMYVWVLVLGIFVCYFYFFLWNCLTFRLVQWKGSREKIWNRKKVTDTILNIVEFGWGLEDFYPTFLSLTFTLASSILLSLKEIFILPELLLSLILIISIRGNVLNYIFLQQVRRGLAKLIDLGEQEKYIL